MLHVRILVTFSCVSDVQKTASMAAACCSIWSGRGSKQLKVWVVLPSHHNPVDKGFKMRVYCWWADTLTCKYPRGECTLFDIGVFTC